MRAAGAPPAQCSPTASCRCLPACLRAGVGCGERSQRPCAQTQRGRTGPGSQSAADQAAAEVQAVRQLRVQTAGGAARQRVGVSQVSTSKATAAKATVLRQPVLAPGELLALQELHGAQGALRACVRAFRKLLRSLLYVEDVHSQEVHASVCLRRTRRGRREELMFGRPVVRTSAGGPPVVSTFFRLCSIRVQFSHCTRLRRLHSGNARRMHGRKRESAEQTAERKTSSAPKARLISLPTLCLALADAAPRRLRCMQSCSLAWWLAAVRGGATLRRWS